MAHINSLAPKFCNWWLRYYAWNCHEEIATEPHWKKKNVHENSSAILNDVIRSTGVIRIRWFSKKLSRKYFIAVFTDSGNLRAEWWPICRPYIEGILPKGPYLPCVSMAGRALLAGYPRYIGAAFERRGDSDHQQCSLFLVVNSGTTDLASMVGTNGLVKQLNFTKMATTYLVQCLTELLKYDWFCYIHKP